MVCFLRVGACYLRNIGFLHVYRNFLEIRTLYRNHSQAAAGGGKTPL